MNKTEFINEYAAKRDITKVEATEQVNDFLEVMQNGVAETGDLTLTNIISIKTKFIEAHVGRNPRTGEEMDIPGKNRLFASFGNGFKARVNEEKTAPKKATKKAVATKAPKTTTKATAKKTVAKIVKKKK